MKNFLAESSALDFDYKDKDAVASQVEHIKEDLLKACSYTDTTEQSKGFLKSDHFELAKEIFSDKHVSKFLKAHDTEYDNYVREQLENWDRLNDTDRMKILRRGFEIANGSYYDNVFAGFKKITGDDGKAKFKIITKPIENLSRKRKYNELAEKYLLDMRDLRDKFKNYRVFLLKLAADEGDLETTSKDINDKLKHGLLQEDYLSMAKLSYSYGTAYQSFGDTIQGMFRLSDRDELEIQSEDMLELEMSLAEYELEQGKNKKLSPKEFLVHLLNLDEHYEILDYSHGFIKNMIKRSDKNLTLESSKERKYKKIFNDVQYSNDILQDGRTFGDIWISEEKNKIFQDNFFFDKDLSEEEKMLRLARINVRLTDVKDKVASALYGRNEQIEFSKTDDNKLEIKISNSAAMGKDFVIKPDGTKIDSRSNEASDSFSYIVDPYTGELDSYKIAGQIYHAKKTLSKELINDINEDIKLIYANAESNFDIKFFSVLNKKLPNPLSVITSFVASSNLLNSKQSISRTFKNGYKIEASIEEKIGNAEFKGLLARTSLADILASVNISKDTKQIKLDHKMGLTLSNTLGLANGISNVFSNIRDNLSQKISLGYLTYSLNKNELSFGKSGSSFFGLPVKMEDGLLKLDDSKPMTRISESLKDKWHTMIDAYNILKCGSLKTEEAKIEAIKIASDNENLKEFLDGDSIKFGKVKEKLEKLISEHVNFIKELFEFKKDIENNAEMSQAVEYLDSSFLEKAFKKFAKGKTSPVRTLNDKSVYVTTTMEDLEEKTKEIKGDKENISLKDAKKILEFTDSDSRMLHSLLETQTSDYKTKDQICDLFAKVNHIENFYSEVYAVQKYYKEDNTITNAYNREVKTRIKNSIANEDYETFFNIFESGHFNDTIASELLKTKGSKSMLFLQMLRAEMVEKKFPKQRVENLDNIISKYKKEDPEARLHLKLKVKQKNNNEMLPGE